MIGGSDPPADFDQTICVVYAQATGDIVATHRLATPRGSSDVDHRAFERSVLEAAARESGRSIDELAALTLDYDGPFGGALHRVDPERRTLVTVDARRARTQRRT